ncbi:hypothetical protein [Nocardiopsis lambiniae]|uniref:Uncharacterized protein n=1 Tax=Nocardiopsis lambiniae TaxID=3075539 RepID=A0ABU2M509_9ACTN|nr:hypothetical protein [Nocardiopsis sp. DSM 44743]MDT0327673.1 hypothetical protein [Nocardiopsis sp. DSM 44743]
MVEAEKVERTPAGIARVLPMRMREAFERQVLEAVDPEEFAEIIRHWAPIADGLADTSSGTRKRRALARQRIRDRVVFGYYKDSPE